MQKLQTVNAETLLYEPLEKPSFVVDSLIPTGLSLFCGSQKIGKSWLMLKLCLCVSQGIPLWDMPTMEGDVLYLCLEDTFCRIQDRLFRLTDEASGRLHFAVASCKLSDGLIVQLEDYLKDYPDSRLIVIDTLQKVRTASKDNAYASDYGDISLIKDFADRHSLAVIVVHHIRKQNDSDVFNKVSGTTGLTGSADATFVLEKEKRASDTAKLYVTGRDTPYQEYTLRFRDCRWELVERKTQEQLAKETIPDVLFRLVDFMRDKEEWIGTATELLAAMGETETIPTVITKWLNEYRTTFLSENRICYQYSRRKDGRQIALARRAGDSGDGGDSDFRIPCRCHPCGRTPRKRKMQAWDSPALFGRVKSPLRSEKSLRFFRLRLQGVTHYTLPCKEPCARRSLWTPLWQVLRPAILRLAASDKRTAA